MGTQIIGTSACQEHFFPQKSATAARLGPAARKELSLRVPGRTESVTGLAQSHGVSRKFLYQQAGKASDAIDEAFGPDRPLLGTIYLVMAMSFIPNAIWESWPFSWRIVPPPARPCGKSPAELLNGKAHPHWPELLGFERFQRN